MHVDVSFECYKSLADGIQDTDLRWKKVVCLTMIYTIEIVTLSNILNKEFFHLQIPNCSSQYNVAVGAAFSCIALAVIFLNMFRTMIISGKCLYKQFKYMDEGNGIRLYKISIFLAEFAVDLMTMWIQLIVVATSESILDIVLNCTAVVAVSQADEALFNYFKMPIVFHDERHTLTAQGSQLDGAGILLFIASGVCYGGIVLTWLNCMGYIA